MSAQSEEKNADITIRLYLDEDLDSDLLISILREEGFVVISPREIGMRRKNKNRKVTDEMHLAFAVSKQCILLTHNTDHFLALHNNWRKKDINHYGIILIHKYNNPGKDMAPGQIVRAIYNILRIKLEFKNSLYHLNDFKY